MASDVSFDQLVRAFASALVPTSRLSRRSGLRTLAGLIGASVVLVQSTDRGAAAPCPNVHRECKQKVRDLCLQSADFSACVQRLGPCCRLAKKCKPKFARKCINKKLPG